MKVPAIFINVAQGEVTILVEHRSPLCEHPEQLVIAQVRVKQIPLEGEGVLCRFGRPEGFVGLRLHPKTHLASERQPPLFAQRDVLDRIEKVFLVASRLAVQIAEILIVAQVEVLRCGLGLILRRRRGRQGWFGGLSLRPKTPLPHWGGGGRGEGGGFFGSTLSGGLFVLTRRRARGLGERRCRQQENAGPRSAAYP